MPNSTMMRFINLTRKTREWWWFLRSLNDQVEHPFEIPLEVSLGATVPETAMFKIPSGYNFYGFAMSGFVAWVPQALQGAVADPQLRVPFQCTVQVTMDVPEARLFDSPVTIGQITGGHLKSMAPIEFGHPLRLQHDCTVKAEFSALAGYAGTHRMGVKLYGILITQDALDAANLDARMLERGNKNNRKY